MYDTTDSKLAQLAFICHKSERSMISFEALNFPRTEPKRNDFRVAVFRVNEGGRSKKDTGVLTNSS